jgi:hypothetical protein
MMVDPVVCPYCMTEAKLVDSAVIYHGRSYGMAWICGRYPACDAYVGCHPNSEKPLGRLADGALRKAKQRAHRAFDPLWKAKMRRDHVRKGVARRAGYEWLAKMLKISVDDCHIGMFDIATCDRVVEICTTPRTRHGIDKAERERLGSGGVANTKHFRQRQTFGPASGVRKIDPEQYEMEIFRGQRDQRQDRRFKKYCG